MRDSASLVSLIVTTRNSERTLLKCLESARRQDYDPIELIVVDNSSTDGTRRIATALADIFIESGPERSTQRNAGIKAAHGDYVLILDADMVLADNVVSEAVLSAKLANAVAIPEESFGEGFWSACKVFERTFYTGDPLVSAARFFRRQRALDV